MRNRVIGLSLAVIASIGMASAASAASKLPYPYNDKAANLQAMQWYAQQQMSQGLPNPYPGLGGVYNYGYNSSYVNPYYNNYNYGYNTNYANPYYGYNGNSSNWWF
jgi:hypothetical protein